MVLRQSRSLPSRPLRSRLLRLPLRPCKKETTSFWRSMARLWPTLQPKTHIQVQQMLLWAAQAADGALPCRSLLSVAVPLCLCFPAAPTDANASSHAAVPQLQQQGSGLPAAAAAPPAAAAAAAGADQEDSDDDLMITLDENATAVEPQASRFSYMRQAAPAGTAAAPPSGPLGAAPGQHVDTSEPVSAAAAMGGRPGGFGAQPSVGGLPRSAIPGLGGAAAPIPGLGPTGPSLPGNAPSQPAAAAAAVAAPSMRPQALRAPQQAQAQQAGALRQPVCARPCVPCSHALDTHDPAGTCACLTPTPPRPLTPPRSPERRAGGVPLPMAAGAAHQAARPDTRVARGIQGVLGAGARRDLQLGPGLGGGRALEVRQPGAGWHQLT